jgi:hypothetical protein
VRGTGAVFNGLDLTTLKNIPHLFVFNGVWKSGYVEKAVDWKD